MKISLITTIIISLNLFFPIIRAEEETLLQTYQRELAFLAAQKRSLVGQKKVIEKEFLSKVTKAKVSLDKEQNLLVKLTKENELLSSKVLEAERGLENVDNANSLLETTLLQGKVTLEFTEKEWEKVDSNDKKIKAIFEKTSEFLYSGGQTRTEKGTFFNSKGALVNGDVLKVGRIASYGHYEGQFSMLFPVGLGKLKLSDEVLGNDLKSLTTAALPDELPLFLYENTSKGIEIKKEKSFFDIVKAGGAIAYVIVGLGLVALVLALIRGILLYAASRFDKSLLDDIQKGEVEKVVQKTGTGKTPFDRVLNKTIGAKNKDRESRENVIHESILGELNYLDKFGAIILVMAAVAPLLGLLGTVTGMISTFDIITEFGTGDPKLLSSGISEALITTKLGLVVAIPSLLLGNLLGGWSGKIKVMLEREALRLSNNFDGEKA